MQGHVSHREGDPREVVVGAVQLLQLGERGDSLREEGEGVVRQLEVRQPGQSRKTVRGQNGDLVERQINF